MSESPFSALIKERSGPLAPQPTGVEPRLASLEGIRAVLFDVYGTLLISGSGDIGTEPEPHLADCCSAALEAVGRDGLDGADLLLQLRRAIQAIQTEIREKEGVEYPEIDIRNAWRRALQELAAGEELSPAQLEKLAVEYECRANPVWPMPQAIEAIEFIKQAGLRLGIVSNAQFFTLELFPALFDRTLTELGFDPDLLFFSFQHRQAKPGSWLYQLAAQRLASLQVSADEVLYIGNDLLNDVTPAQAVGFRTALFAGDARSLRTREGDPRVAGVAADVVITQLGQLKQVMGA